MNFIIRNANKEDWNEIKFIYESGISTGLATFETTSPPTFEQWALKAHPECTLMAYEGNAIVGWCKVTPISERLVYAGVGEVSVYVHPEAQGKGVGDFLLKNLIYKSEEQGFWTLQASIFPENINSIYLHKKNNFREVGIREKIRQLKGVWRDNVLLERRNSVGLDK